MKITAEEMKALDNFMNDYNSTTWDSKFTEQKLNDIAHAVFIVSSILIKLVIEDGGN